MDLKYYLSILWANKWIIITTLVVTLVVVIVGTMLITPIYSASTTLRVAAASTSSISYTDYVYADRLMNTYTKIATSRPVLDELVAKLNLQTTPDVKVSTIPSTELIKILVNSPDPAVAQNAANTLAEILSVQSQELYSGGEKSTAEILSEQLQIAEADLNQARADYDALVTASPNDAESIAKASLVTDFKQKTYETLLEQYEAARVREAIRANTITIIEPAVLPLSPSQPNLLINIALGVIVGLVGGLGLVFLFENLNPRLYTLDQIETVTELDVIGKIPSVRPKGLSGFRKNTLKTNSSVFKESFHKLQTKIYQQNTTDQTIKSLMITSAVPGEGKSTIIANLALAMGKTGQKVIVVDCDMRIPTQHKIFNLPNKLGLSSLLHQQSMLIDVLQKSHNPNTWVITSGPIPSNPIELLGSPQMKSLIELLVQKFAYVLLDTPALLPVGDAIVLSTLVDAMVLVTRQTYIKEDVLREACKLLTDTDRKIIGVIVNEAKQNGTHYYYSGKYTH
jgi:non-specific protein-tyrosine kinase